MRHLEGDIRRSTYTFGSEKRRGIVGVEIKDIEWGRMSADERKANKEGIS